jgi:DNA-binding NarL/FixJ family response regulator
VKPWRPLCCGGGLGDLLSRIVADTETPEQLAVRVLMPAAAAVLAGSPQPRREATSGRLSPRELEVAELVAQGLSNPAIARRLYLSRPTVASHVAHILTKLDFATRAQIAAWVAGRTIRERGWAGMSPTGSLGPVSEG